MDNKHNHIENANVTDANVSSPIAPRKKNFGVFYTFIRNIRKAFAKSCEESLLATILDKVYYLILNSSIRIAAVFLTAFGISSLIFNYIIDFSGLMFFTNTNHVGAVMLLVIGLILFTTKKTVGELLSGSKVFSQFSIVYSQSAILSQGTVLHGSFGSYSTALFLGIILGIISILFPAAYLALFIVSFIYAIFIFNRPECGILLTLFALPFVSHYTILLFAYITFIALVYKYLRGKRHMNFGPMTVVMIVAALLFVCKGYFTNSGERNYITTLSYLGFILVCITTVNLVRATSMLNKGINLLAGVTRVYIIVFILYYLSCIFFGIMRTQNFIDGLMFSGLLSAVSEMSFFTPMLSIAVPINFAVMISSKNAAGFIKNVIFFIIMLVSSFFVSMYAYTLILLLSCVMILCFIKKRFLLLALPCPAIAFGIVKLYELIPDAYSASVFSESTVSGNAVYMLIRDNLLFGIGLGKKNFDLSIAKYSDTASASNWWITNSTLFNTVLAIGLVGTVLLLVIIAFMITKNIDFILNSDKTQTKKVRLLSAGLFAATLSFVISCFFLDCIYDFRIAFLFAVVISLGYASKQCIEADYVDATTVREYKQF